METVNLCQLNSGSCAFDFCFISVLNFWLSGRSGTERMWMWCVTEIGNQFCRALAKNIIHCQGKLGRMLQNRHLGALIATLAMYTLYNDLTSAALLFKCPGIIIINYYYYFPDEVRNLIITNFKPLIIINEWINDKTSGYQESYLFIQRLF